MDKFCITSQKQSFNTVLFSAHSVNSSIEDLSNAMDFVLRDWREDMLPCIIGCVSILRACPPVELVVNYNLLCFQKHSLSIVHTKH